MTLGRFGCRIVFIQSEYVGAFFVLGYLWYVRVLFLLGGLCHSPLTLSEFDRFEYLRVDGKRVVRGLGRARRFRIYFILGKSLYLFESRVRSVPLVTVRGRFFFVDDLRRYGVGTVSRMRLIVRTYGVITPCLRDEAVRCLRSVSVRRMGPMRILPVCPLVHSCLSLLISCVGGKARVPSLRQTGRCRLFSLFGVYCGGGRVTSVFHSTLSGSLRFFMSIVARCGTYEATGRLTILYKCGSAIFARLFGGGFRKSAPCR